MDDKLHVMLREYAWKYFSMHADQRFKTFGFYVTLATVITGLLVARLKETTDWRGLSILAFLLTFMTLVFWRFELRNKQLVRNGEAALRYLDSLLRVENEGGVPHVLRIVARDDYLSGQGEDSPKKRRWTHSSCFNAVFLVFGLSSLLFGLYCWIK